MSKTIDSNKTYEQADKLRSLFLSQVLSLLNTRQDLEGCEVYELAARWAAQHLTTTTTPEPEDTLTVIIHKQVQNKGAWHCDWPGYLKAAPLQEKTIFPPTPTPAQIMAQLPAGHYFDNHNGALDDFSSWETIRSPRGLVFMYCHTLPGRSHRIDGQQLYEIWIYDETEKDIYSILTSARVHEYGAISTDEQFQAYISTH